MNLGLPALSFGVRLVLLEAMIGQIYMDFFPRGYNFMTHYMEEGDKLNGAFDRFSIRR